MTTESQYSQTDNWQSTEIPSSFPQIVLKVNGQYTNAVKMVIAEISAKCRISLNQARIAFQTISNQFFGQKYFLSRSDAPSANEKLYAIPSRSTLIDFKHLMALAQEQNCALSLLNSENAVVSWFYDSTTREGIKGEITTMSIKVGEQIYHLRPLMLGRETRENIVRLFVAQITRLATFIKVPPKQLWEKVTVLATDSVSKNLQIGPLIAKELDSFYEPFHVLCNSHFCEACDRAMLYCLEKIETSLNLKEAVIAIQPSLSSFLRNKTVSQAAIEAMSVLVANNGKKSNQSELFEEILLKKDKHFQAASV